MTYHEGWHQFADLYFSTRPGTVERASLHRWFDEGHGDYFGSFRWGRGQVGSTKGSAMRHDVVQNMVRVGDYVPFKDIVTKWHMRRKFYGPNARRTTTPRPTR